MTHRLLLDTSSLTYRAFFAVPASITDGAGRPVNAIRGYLDMTAQLLRDRRDGALPEVLHVFDDAERPDERVAAYPGYKSERAAEPDGLGWQFAFLREVLPRLGHTVVRAEGWEADDAIGTLCAAARPGDRLDIVTGDRDLLQLVRDGDPAVRVLFTVKGVKELAVFDEAAVEAKYGVPPQRYVDFAILRGDPSDGLPGIKGVGPKTAVDLVRRYPDLLALAEDADAQTPRLAEQLRRSLGYLTAMLDVVPVRPDVELEVVRGERDDDHLAEVATRHRIESPIQRLQEAMDA